MVGASYEICLFDPNDRDREVEPGQVGEIGGRGAALMLGYFNNQTATEGSFNSAGWFVSVILEWPTRRAICASKVV